MENLSERMMLLVLQLGIIIFAAKLVGVAFAKLRLPGVLGEVTAGIILSAHLLGGVELPGFETGLFPMFGNSAVSPELYAIASIGSIVLLFDVGLETDLKLLIRYSFAGTVVGIGGIVVSFISGVLVCYFLADAIGLSLHLADPLCLMMGIASTATSVGITARVLSDAHRLDSPESVTILSAAVVDDVLGIILLAIVMAVAVSTGTGRPELDWGGIALIGTKALGVWLAATVLGIAASRRISWLLKMFKDRSSIAVMSLGLAMILSGVFEKAGLAMIIGAYVMGLSLSKSDISRVIHEKLHTVYMLLVPVFFCVTGMMIDLRTMAEPGLLFFALIYAGSAMAAKIFGCGLPALLVGFNLRGAIRVGVGMVPRGEVGLIIASLGLASGVLSNQMYAAIIAMVMINTMVAPPFIEGLFRGNSRGLRRAPVENKEDHQPLEFEFGSFPMLELFVTRLSVVLEADGFYTHLLSRPDLLYQARKEATVIEYQRMNTRLRFSCRAEDIPLIRRIVLETAASVDAILTALRTPGGDAIFNPMKTEPPGPEALPDKTE